MKDIDKLYSQLQARCCMCNEHIKSVNQAKVMVDNNGDNQILCLDCAEKYKDKFREQTEKESQESMSMFILGLLAITGDFDGTTNN